MITNEDAIRSMSHKELYDFLNTIAQDGPWYEEFDKQLCQNCKPITIGNDEYAFCEIEGNKCPYYNGDPLEWWLNKEARNVDNG